MREYLSEYNEPARFGARFHRPISAYLNEVIGLGCRLTAIVEPGATEGVCAHIPNYIVVAAVRE